MTNTMKLIDILVDRKKRSIEELVELTGLPVQKVRNAITALSLRKMAVAEPVRYSLTPKGMQRHGWRPMTYEELRERARKGRALVRAERRRAQAAIGQANAERDRVAVSLRAQAVNSVFALGARNGR